MKQDGPSIAVASGLAGLLGMFCPVAGGDVLDFSLNLMGENLSLESTGLFWTSRLMFVPSVCILACGAWALFRKSYSRKQASLTLLLSLFAGVGWMVQSSIIEKLSMVGVTASLGLFLLLVSAAGGGFAGLLGLIWPTVREKKPASPSLPKSTS